MLTKKIQHFKTNIETRVLNRWNIDNYMMRNPNIKFDERLKKGIKTLIHLPLITKCLHSLKRTMQGSTKESPQSLLVNKLEIFSIKLLPSASF